MDLTRLDPTTMSIFLQLSRRIPLSQGIVILQKLHKDPYEMSTKEIVSFWIEQMPKFVSESIETFLNALDESISNEDVDLAGRSDLAGFTLGDLSKQFNRNATNSSGVDWRFALPNGLIALFNAIPIDWSNEVKVLQEWLTI